MTKTMTYEYAAKEFLKNYIKENNIKGICELFSKDTLIEHTYDSDWEWSIEDEMEIYGCSEEEAQKRTYEWFQGMSKLELWQDHISTGSQDCLIVGKAEDLGFEWEE